MESFLRDNSARRPAARRRAVLQEGGATLAIFAVFLGLVLLPLLSLAVEMGRYAEAASEVQKAADAASLAASQDVDVRAWRDRGVFLFSPSVYADAQTYANKNAAHLASKGIVVRVTSITMNRANRTVRVVCKADVSPLFPEGTPGTTIIRAGTAQAAWR